MTVAYNNRDHQEILVIDGQDYYTGGVNLWMSISTRERLVIGRISAVPTVEPSLPWRDSFSLNWYINQGEIEDFDKYHMENQAVDGEGLYPLWEWTETHL